MSLSNGIAFVKIREMLISKGGDPTDAPEPFMLAMADDEEHGMHFFMSAAEAEKLAIGILETICVGHA